MAWAKKRKYVAKRKMTARKRAPAPTKSLATQVVSAIGGYALQRLKQKLGINAETKYSTDTTRIFTPTNTLAKAFDLLTNVSIPQDNTAQGRSGLGIRMTRWHVHGSIDNDLANLLTTRFRIMVVANAGIALGAQPFLITDILERTTDINSPILIDSTVPIKVLYDRTFNIDPISAGGKQQFVINFDYKPLNHHITWTVADTTGVPSDLLKGYIGVYIMVDGATAAHFPTLNVAKELYWVDN